MEGRASSKRFNRVRFRSILLVAALLFWLAGCASSTDRRHPEFNHRIQAIRTLCLLSSDIIVFEELPDGRLQQRSKRSEAARFFVQQALVAELTARNFRVSTYPADAANCAGELQEVLDLYRAVNRSIQLHTFGPEVFTVKKDRFEYSVGPLTTLLQQNGADAIVFVRVLHRYSSERSRSFISLGLADASGTILWYGANGNREAKGIEDVDGTTHLVRKALNNFPEGRL
jgi:hypothetical protein